MNDQQIKLDKIEHRGQIRISVTFPFNPENIEKIKQIPGYRWSQTKRCWHIPYTPQAFRALKAIFGEVIIIYPEKHRKEYPEKIRQTLDQVIHRKSFDQGSTRTQTLSPSGATPDPIFILSIENDFRLKAKIPYYKKDWIRVIKNIPGFAWNAKNKYWSLPYVKHTLQHLQRYIGSSLTIEFTINKNIPEKYIQKKASKPLRQKSKIDFRLNTEQLESLNALEEQLLYERRSPSTIKAYLANLKSLILHYPNTSPENISDDQIKDYLIQQIKRKKISISTQNQFLNAIKVYYKRILHQERELLELRRPKKPNRLPHILDQSEVVRIIHSVDNIKHKCILMLIYSAGLRVSEVINLKVKDVDSKRMQLFIQGGKGKKDRYTLLSKKTLILLRTYFKQYHPFDWLFEGQHGGKYSARSVQNIFQRAVQKARITKRPTLHTLRHSFATHLLDKGINLRYIQELLGHESSRTTEIYTHITKQGIGKIESPLDGLDI